MTPPSGLPVEPEPVMRIAPTVASGGGGGARAKREMMPVMVTLPAAGETFEETKSDEAPVRVRVLPKHVAVGSLSDAKGGDLDDPDFDF